MFFERRTARGPPSRKKRCRPSPRTALPLPPPPPPPPPFSTPASLSAPPRPAMAPTARKYTPISRPCYPRIPQFIFPCADPRESRFIGRRRECSRLRARSLDGIPADGTASCLLLPSNSFFLRTIRWGWVESSSLSKDCRLLFY